MPSLVRKPAAAACAPANGGTASLPQRRAENDHFASRKNSPGTKQSAVGTHLGEPKDDDGGGKERVSASFQKRSADQLGEEMSLEEESASAGTIKSSIDLASYGGSNASRPRKKKKAKPAPPVVDWRVQRIARDLGRLDVLRRGDVGPDVVSDDEDETALDILASW